ncbi:MAG: Cna B-type domain-containing protein [Anaerovoracaceae bacterium]
MQNLSGKARIRLGILFLALLAAIGMIWTFAPMSHADGEYTVYMEDEGTNTGFFRARLTANANSDSDPIVYCLDRDADWPLATGQTGYTLHSGVSDSELASYAASGVTESEAQTIRNILYYGYPNLGGDNGTAWTEQNGTDVTSYTDSELRSYTLAAIWNITNPNWTPFPYSQATTLVETAEANSAPSNFVVDTYTQDGIYQNFARGYLQTSSTYSAEFTVNKSWLYSSTSGSLAGTAYSGTTPDVTLYLYKDSVSESNLVDTQTISSGYTSASFSLTSDTAGDQTYILHEEISTTDGDGVTFETAADKTITITFGSDSSSGNYNQTLVNYVNQTTEINYTKSWPDGNPTAGTRIVTVALMMSTDDGETWSNVTDDSGVNVTAEMDGVTDDTESTAWAGSFTDLPVSTSSGDEITYDVQETAVEDASGNDLTSYYDSSSTTSDNTVTLVNEEKTTDIAYEKRWPDGDPTSGTTVTIALLQSTDGGTTWTNVTDDSGSNVTATLDGTETDPWTGTFSDLPLYDGTTEIEYMIEETSVLEDSVESIDDYNPEYSVEDDTYIVTNNSAGETSVAFAKSWVGPHDGITVTFKLQESTDGGETWTDEGSTAELDGAIDTVETEAWIGHFYDLDSDLDYRVVETAVTDSSGNDVSSNYTASDPTLVDNVWTTTNTNNEKDEITVTKIWAGSVDPEHIGTVGIDVYNGVDSDPVASFELTGSIHSETSSDITFQESPVYTGTISNLPKYDDSGNEYTYSVKETYVLDKDGNDITYLFDTPEISHSGTEWTIYNKLDSLYASGSAGDDASGSITTGDSFSAAPFIALMAAAAAVIGIALARKQHNKG